MSPTMTASNLGSSGLGGARLPLSLLPLLLLLFGVAAGAATVSEVGGSVSGAAGPYDSYYEFGPPNSRLYNACGMQLVFLMIRTCKRHGGLYVPEKDPMLEELSRLSNIAPTPPAARPRNPCRGRKVGQRDPFLDCCCGYCSEDTLRGYCSDEVRDVSLAQFPRARPAKMSN